MSHQLKQHQIIKFLYSLGLLSIPVICAPLLLPLVLAKLPATSPQQAVTPSPAKIPSKPQKLSDAADNNWHRQLMHQLLLASKKVEQQKPQNTALPHRNQAKAPSPKTAPELKMRIAIAKNASDLLIATSTPGKILDETGHTLRKLPSEQGFSAVPAGQKIDFTGNSTGTWSVPTSVWVKASPGGFVYVGQHWYRGQVQLILQGASLLAVNHVDLDEYLYSVVGSEMPSNWPLEALKAQAIAARSYALAHYIQPANSFYQMGNDEAWQVYKGLDGEAASTHQAVNQTLGQFLSYRGGVVESLYADTDEIVIKAHGGLGMSQTGAMQLAQQGYDYLHILGAYYPGTSLARLRLAKS
ncbi:MAG: SpoIID/LytB domain-containing protein [Chroococcidiopsidaceae cyanobacterium CP_BM_ER_R8_30]|nr:SpoIID/LytB domain-containing protein [Chroococcidiopsidaceae cyanobacterium CP_BM_ER_R8_30]